MALSKSLLLKGIAGVAAVGGVATGGAVAVNSGLLGGGDNGVADLRGDGKDGELGKFSHRELIDGLGLSCQLTGKELKESEDKECKVKDNGTLNIKIDEKTEEGVTFTTSDAAKLKVGRSKGGVREESQEVTETYSRGLKFVVDSGDITLTKKEGSGSPTTITKLEQFETYEIKKEGDKFYLSRKTKAKEGIKNALGLGELTLPDAGGEIVDRSFGDEKNIKKIRFEGHEDGISISSGSIILKVSKTVDTTTFPYGYRFNFTFPGDQTINGKQLKGKIPYEFKIKKGTGNSLTLEQAWTDDNTFTKKAGLDCSTNPNECSVSSDSQKLNVKVGHQKKVDITNITGSGKIKMEKDKEGYNQGLKFSITSGDATLSGGTGEEITKLEELETYEIAEDGGKYYLTKKTSPDELIKSSLSLPEGCKLPGEASVECALDEANFKKINFDGKEANKPTGTATLTISKANSTDFPFGYKFTFKTEADTEIKASNTTIKAKIPKDFKIKKNTTAGSGQSTSLSLEKAWDDSNYSLAAKVGLTCTTNSGTECCSQTAGGSPSVKLNVKKGTDIKTDIDSVTTSSTAKIKVEKDKEGYNQGLKFTITGGDVTLTGGSGGTFTTLEELETYEITEDKGKYYLTRKTSKEDVLKTSLSIPEGCFTSLGTSCTLTSDNFKGINFDGKDNFSPSGTATLTITKTSSTDFPLGYRFTFKTEAEATVKTDTKIKAKIPTDFKIKRGSESGQSPSLSLEKAWTDGDYSFAKKVGLTCTTGNGECCSLSSGSTLNVKRGNETKTGITAISAANSGSEKIKVEKDKEGYNQGLKFTISEGDVSLTGGEGGSFTKLEEYETYEITEEGDKYYLTRKTEASETIGDLLGLKGAGCSLSTSSASCTLTSEQIKSINFDGKDTTGATMASGSATLTIAKAGTSDFPLGYKFTLQSDSSDITIKTNTTTVKAKIPTEFKIKKAESGQTPTLSLEKAWTAESLGKKVGLTCSNGTSSNECSKSSDANLNIKKDSDKKEGVTGTNSSSKGKIKVEKDQEGYNYGLKFYIDGGDVALTGGTDSKRSGSNEDLSVLEEYETYEIKEEGGKYYLTRKDESIVFLKKQLGIESFCNDDTWRRYNTSGTINISFSCEDIKNVENLKKIKFNNNSNSSSHNWPTGNINLLLEMKRQKTNNNNTYGEIEVTISDNRGSTEGGAETICIPDGNGGKINISKKNNASSKGAEYKIKKSGSGASTTLCLEKKSGGSGGGSC